MELGVSITGIPLDPAWQVGRGNGRNQLVAVRLFGLADCNGLVDISTDVDLLHAPSVFSIGFLQAELHHFELLLVILAALEELENL